MKVLFIARSTLYSNKGGDTIQVLKTAEFLKHLNVSVDIRTTNEVTGYRDYDLLHFFNIIRPADILHHISASGKPYVVSSIFVDYSEYEKKVRKGLASILFALLSSDQIEYCKAIARWLVNGEKITSSSYLLLGQKRSIRKIIKGAAMILPNSNNEYRRLQAAYAIDTSFRVIPNAIDPTLFKKPQAPPKRDDNVILCVGRIEGIKNQLNLIRAVSGTQYQLILIGDASVNQQSYYHACRQAAGPNVTFINKVPQEALIEYYCKAKVHILPSWFETTGLSSLEAAAMGCNIVVTDKGDTKEYFEDYALYCDPASPDSILSAIRKAASKDFDDSLQKKVLEKYTWSQAAQKTLEAYQELF